ncbi:histidine kinase, partial [Mastigocladus laminosus WC112]
DETKRLSRLIGGLLDLGRLEAGVTLLEKQHIQLVSLIRLAVRAVETRMQNSQISAQVNVADLQIQGDSERLLQALLNLLDNGIKHSPPDSQIFITASKEGRSHESSPNDSTW